MLYSDSKGLQVSYSNEQPLQTVEVPDPLANIKIGKSIVSGSVKFMAAAYAKLLNGEPVDEGQFCTLEQAYANMRHLDID